MLFPKKRSFRKDQRGRLKGVSNASSIVFGQYGLQALQPVWVTARQIEATRRSLVRRVRKFGRVWIRIFPDKPITERSAESRMGSGKGSVSHWVASVKPGAILFEISGLEKKKAYDVLKLASYKLPMKTKFVFSL